MRRGMLSAPGETPLRAVARASSAPDKACVRVSKTYCSLAGAVPKLATIHTPTSAKPTPNTMIGTV